MNGSHVSTFALCNSVRRALCELNAYKDDQSCFSYLPFPKREETTDHLSFSVHSLRKRIANFITRNNAHCVAICCKASHCWEFYHLDENKVYILDSILVFICVIGACQSISNTVSNDLVSRTHYVANMTVHDPHYANDFFISVPFSYYIKNVVKSN